VAENRGDERGEDQKMARNGRRLAGVLVTGALVAGGLTACGDPPDDAFAAFVKGLGTGDTGGVKVTTSSGQPVTRATLTALEGDLAGRKPQVRVSGINEDGDHATATLTYRWPIAQGATWEYKSVVKAKQADDKWTILFDPSALHPDLQAGDHLAMKRTPADRGAILDGTGQPIVSKQGVVDVVIQPSQVTETPGIDGVVKALSEALQTVKDDTGPIDLSSLAGDIKSASADAAVPVVRLRRSTYDKIRSKVYDLPGVQFQESNASLSPSRSFAKALLGRVGDVTKEQIDKNPEKYQVGDQVGQGGLQEQYDKVLGGTPGVSIRVAKGDKVTDKELFRSDSKPGSPIKTTIDQKTQNAADNALKGQANRSAIVAVKVSDGSVLAVANGPDGGDLDIALTGRTAPGSTFKTITALGVMDSGQANPSTVVPCPKEWTAPGGSPIRNSHDLPLGDNAQLHQDFAQSCNTAFASLGSKLGPDGLAATARTVGIGVPWDLGPEVFSGSVATGADSAEQAAAAFGQGKTQVSPAALAGAAAAIARGQWQQPKLVTDPAPAKPAPAGPQLKPDVVAGLKQMMGEVVTQGTAVSIKNTPGGPIYGKTGTAEFDNNDKDRTHSWFMGFQGDVAFAVFVENGGLSSDAAVPIAGRFLTGLH
jgi:cell division protein FtsI/penicillin-binding protein 2